MTPLAQTAPRPKLHELDAWFKSNGEGNELDDALRLRGVTWGSLSYERKLAMFELAQPSTPALRGVKTSSDSAARAYHARPEVIEYFERNHLLHESGDYRANAPVASTRFLLPVRDLSRRFLPRLSRWAQGELIVKCNCGPHSIGEKVYE